MSFSLGDYEVARKKSKLAEETSDLNSDYEIDRARPKRRTKRKFVSDSEDEVDVSCSFIKTPPKITRAVAAEEAQASM